VLGEPSTKPLTITCALLECDARRAADALEAEALESNAEVRISELADEFASLLFAAGDTPRPSSCPSEESMIAKYAGDVDERKTGAGIAELRIEAWDDDDGSGDLLACSWTDAAGAFTLRCEAGAALGIEGQAPALYFKIWRERRLLLTTRGKRVWRPTEGDGRGRFHVVSDKAPSDGEGPSSWTLRGRVFDEDGTPIAQANRCIRQAVALRARARPNHDGAERPLHHPV
jgi:hypothetical protein